MKGGKRSLSLDFNINKAQKLGIRKRNLKKFEKVEGAWEGGIRKGKS